MAQTSVFLLFLLFSLSSATVEISHSSEVMEGTWAEFSCTTKKANTVKWRIGSFTDGGHKYNAGDQLHKIEKLQAQHARTVPSGDKITEVIRILATMDLNGLPIECMSRSIGGIEKYSPFVLLEVIPSVITEGSGVDQIQRRSLPESEYTEVTTSGGQQSVIAASLFAVFCSVVAITESL